MTSLLNANALRIPLADESVDCCVSSPPYWGLRDYGTAEWVGGSAECEHVKHQRVKLDSGLRNDGRKHKGLYENEKTTQIKTHYKDTCGKCGAIRVDNQLGLEPTPEEFVANLVTVFREVWRVLKPWGSVWLNLGDSYASKTKGSGGKSDKQDSNKGSFYQSNNVYQHGLKEKDLVGIPWRVAFALQADGWWLRSDIIWAKPNPMPESVTDRPTKAHEYLFLLTKRARYYYDADAVREGNKREWGENNIGSNNRINTGVLEGKVLGRDKDPHCGLANTRPNPSGRNRRTVWTIPTRPYKGAHFATFPPALVEPCIKAGTSERGNCPECGKPWERVVDRKPSPHVDSSSLDRYGTGDAGVHRKVGGQYQKWLNENPKTTLGWQPTCDHAAEPVPAIVLDPFAGSGTTLMVARQLGRDSVGLDLSFDYLGNQARKRLSLDKLALHGKAKQVDAAWQDTPMFQGVENG